MSKRMLLAIICCAWFIAAAGGLNAATYYVSITGDDTNPGAKTEPWRTIAHAAQQAQAGDTVCVEEGNYGHEHVVLSNSGTAAQPIVFKGYNGTPLLDGEDGKGYGILIAGKSYITIDGFEITRYLVGLYGRSDPDADLSTHHINLHNITPYKNHHGIYFAGSHDVVIRHCTAHNNEMCNFLLTAATTNTAIEDCRSFNEEELGSYADYYYAISKGSTNNVIRNCTAGGYAEEGHHWSGHGFCMRHKSSYYRIVNCRSFFSGCEHFAAKEDSEYNEFVNCIAVGMHPDHYVTGFNISASHNKILNCVAREVRYGVLVHWSKGEPSEKLPISNNLFANNTLVNNMFGVFVHWVKTAPTQPPTSDNLFTNNIVAHNEYGIRLAGDTDVIRYNNLWGNDTDYTACSPGVGDMSADPLFADPTAGDFRLRSQYGRWNGKSWVCDDTTSPCIDAGDPANPYSAELQPNGGRANMGAYGGTAEASKSRASEE